MHLASLLSALPVASLLLIMTRPASATVPPDVPKDADERGISVGARGIVGVIEEDGETAFVTGFGALVGLPILRHLEIEPSAFYVFAKDEPNFVVLEVVGKWVFEPETRLAPHATLGPLVSLDVEETVSVSGGLIAGGGLTYWMSDRVGLVADVNYRLLLGSDLRNAVTAALGVKFELP